MVRLAKREDMKAINAIRKEVFDLHVNALPHIFKVVWDEDKEIEFLKTVLSDENVLFYLYVKDKKIIGYAHVEKREKFDRGAKESRRWCHLSDFGVTKSERAKGIGGEFLKAIEKELKSQSFSKLELNVWEFNQSAMKFYEKKWFLHFKENNGKRYIRKEEASASSFLFTWHLINLINRNRLDPFPREIFSAKVTKTSSLLVNWTKKTEFSDDVVWRKVKKFFHDFVDF